MIAKFEIEWSIVPYFKTTYSGHPTDKDVLRLLAERLRKTELYHNEFRIKIKEVKELMND